MTNEVFLTREEIEHPYANLTVMLEDKRRKAEQMSKTVFAKITESPEVLAEISVYAHECCRIPDGATSPFIDNIFWFDDEKGDTWDERFDSAWKKAIAVLILPMKDGKD